MKVTHHCGATWLGTLAEHCPACCLTFSSTRAGDAHRVGQHGVKDGPDRRRCLTVREMRAKKIEEGKRKGEPFFKTKHNAYATQIWFLNHPQDGRWDVQGVDSEGLADVSGTPRYPRYPPGVYYPPIWGGCLMNEWIRQAMIAKHDLMCYANCGESITTYPKLTKDEQAIVERLWNRFGKGD